MSALSFTILAVCLALASADPKPILGGIQQAASGMMGSTSQAVSQSSSSMSETVTESSSTVASAGAQTVSSAAGMAGLGGYADYFMPSYYRGLYPGMMSRFGF